MHHYTKKSIKTAMIRHLIIAVFFIPMLLFSQHNQESLKEKVDQIRYSDDENVVKVSQMLEILSNVDTTQYSEDLGYFYHRLGLLYNNIKDYQKAVTVTKKAIEIRSALDPIDSYALSNSIYNTAVYYKLLGQTKKQLPLLDRLLEVHLPNKYTYKAYVDKSVIHTDNGDYFIALDYLDIVVNSYEKYSDTLTVLLGHQNFLYTYSKMGNSKKYLSEIEKHWGKIKTFWELGWNQDPDVNNNLANIYDGLGQFEKAIQQYEIAEEILIDYYGSDPYHLGAVYNNLGRMYSKRNQPKTANDYYQKSLQISSDVENQAAVYDNQGYYLKTKNPIDKIPYYQKAIATLLGTKKNIEKLPSFAQIQTSDYKLDLLDYLIDLSETWVQGYDTTPNKQYLHKAEKTLFLVDQLVSLIRFDSAVEQSKLFWIRRSVDTYMLAVKVSYLLENPKNAFYFMEKNKALLLLENLNKGINISEQPQILSLEESKRKYATEHSNLIEYILNDQDGYAIFCSANETMLYQLKDISSIHTNIKRFKALISKPIVTKDNQSKYNSVASTLYRQLFPFECSLDKVKGNHLFVIPDHQLQTIPFDALKTAENSDYLIHDVTISYLQSTSVLNALSTTDKKTSEQLLAVAPIEFSDASLVTLEKAENHIKAINNLMSSEMLLKAKATKNAFKSHLENYKIVHLNTHAGLDAIDQNPWLAFYDDKLSLDELYQLNNNAELVVLDACKSASGTLDMGEGVMSLARGFFYNGTKSVIASLWNSNERSSNKILTTFYTELKNGNNTSDALRNAKRDYLNHHELSETSPYYWASLTLTGRVAAIDLGIPFYLRREFITSLIIILLALFFIRKQRSKQ